jgi:hypothetical protein
MAQPDFIIIGAMKSATSTLYEQLVRQPGIFMTTPKEPNFFSDDDQYKKGLDWYLQLFAGSDNALLRGEASTHYSKLPTYPDTIERLSAFTGGVGRFVYVMRHPVDRLISHYMHEWSENRITCDVNEALVRHPELIDYSCYYRQISPWLAKFGQDSILPVFYDRLMENKDDELGRICAFIGYSGIVRWQDIPANNVSSERIRKFPFYDLLVEKKLSVWLRRQLVPRFVRDWIKSTRQMRTKPMLSDETRIQVEAIFNRDLALLGELLGINGLNCRNFHELARTQAYKWQQ